MEKFLPAFDLQCCEAATFTWRAAVFPLISALAEMALRLEVLICDQMDYYHFRGFHAFLSIDVKFLHVFLEKKKKTSQN